MGHTPSEWIGQIVTVCYLEPSQSGCGPERVVLSDLATGELVRNESDAVVLNTGWDGRDYHEARIGGSWVRLEKEKRVRRLQGEDLTARQAIRARAEELRDKAVTATKQSHFGLAEASLRRAVEELAQMQGFDTMPTEGWIDSLTSWVEKTEGVLAKFTEAESELRALQQRKSSGEVLVDFGGRFRVMGATENVQYWVIQSDGTLREPDYRTGRRRYEDVEGEKTWRLVGSDELALVWRKAYTAAPHEFEVAKPPATGLTPAQLASVETIEREIEERFGGSVEGWGFGQRRVKIVRASDSMPASAATPDKPAPASGPFTDMGQRWFRCPSGHTSRLGKTEFVAYTTGEQVTVTCSVCGATGTAQKEG